MMNIEIKKLTIYLKTLAYKYLFLAMETKIKAIKNN